MRLVTAVDFGTEDIAVLDAVAPLLDVSPDVLRDRAAMQHPRTLHRIAHAIREAAAKQREHHELWAAHGADLERRDAVIMRPGAADHMVALTARNMDRLAAAAGLVDRAIAATTPEQDPV